MSSWEQDRTSFRSIKLTGVEEALAVLDPSIVEKAARQSLSRVGASGVTAFSKEIRSIYNVKKRDLDERIWLDPPRSGLRAIINIGGYSLSLSYFGAKQFYGNTVTTRTKTGLVRKKARKLTGPRPAGVQVEVLKGYPVLLQHVFLSKMKSGHIGVFRRIGKGRLPIDEKSVVTFASMAQRPEVEKAVITRIEERWGTEFPRQLAYYQSKAGGGK